MITKRLLDEFKSSNNSTVIITDISCGLDSCGQELLSISTTKIRTPFVDIVKYYNPINKTLEVEGHLELNDNKEYYTNLVGFVSNENNEGYIPSEEDLAGKILNNAYTSPSSHSVEEIKAELAKEIEISFVKGYRYQPHVIVTIDKQYENLYRSYSTEFIKNELDTEYIGVKITFNNLKAKSNYPEIGICIIGDQIESYYDGIVKTETTASIHIFEKKIPVNMYIFEMINMEKADVKNVEVIITDEDGRFTTYKTDNCGEIKPILKYGTYSVKVNNDRYNSTPISINVSEESKDFEIEATIKTTTQTETNEGE